MPLFLVSKEKHFPISIFYWKPNEANWAKPIYWILNYQIKYKLSALEEKAICIWRKSSKLREKTLSKLKTLRKKHKLIKRTQKLSEKIRNKLQNYVKKQWASYKISRNFENQTQKSQLKRIEITLPLKYQENANFSKYKKA